MVWVLNSSSCDRQKEADIISKKMAASLNEQINNEIYSAYLYVSMSAYALSIGLQGFAHWFGVQAKEELGHAEKFFKYVNEQGSRVLLKAVAQPTQDFSSAANLFEETLAHEKKVTGMINNLVDLAQKENDHATEALLQWFVTEQVEEEANATEILQKLHIGGKDGKTLLILDAELARRGN